MKTFESALYDLYNDGLKDVDFMDIIDTDELCELWNKDYFEEAYNCAACAIEDNLQRLLYRPKELGLCILEYVERGMKKHAERLIRNWEDTRLMNEGPSYREWLIKTQGVPTVEKML